MTFCLVLRLGQVSAVADGQVVKVDQSAGRITIKHEPIKKFCQDEGMTMAFSADDPAMLKQVMAFRGSSGLATGHEQRLNGVFLWGSTWQTYDGRDMQRSRRFNVRDSHRKETMTIGKALIAAAMLAI